jgi:chromosome segregation ATPase
MLTADRNKRLAAITLLVLSLASAIALVAGARQAHAGSVGSLSSQLNATQAHESQLSGSISQIQGDIATLSSEARSVAAREAAVHSAYAADQSALAAVQVQVGKERTNLHTLRRVLARALKSLRAQLVARYENQQPTMISVVLNSSGFSQLLDQLNFINRAQALEQETIRFARTAKAHATAAEQRLAALDRHDIEITSYEARENAALSGMNALLTVRENDANRLRSIQEAALGSAQAKDAALQTAINQIQAQEAPPVAASGGGSGGWAIPAPIVMCESGGQNLPPNSAGASGYYQIIPGTWKDYGGSGPAAYLASKAEQDAVAAKIWDGGAGASNWVCSGLTGY